MNRNPYDTPNAPTEIPQDEPPRQMPKHRAAGGRAVAALLGGAALLVLVLVAAAQAQQSEPKEETATAGSTVASQQDSTAAETGAAQTESGGGTGVAQSTEPAKAEMAEPIPFEGQIVMQPEDSFAASELIDRAVTTTEGEEIGRINDLVVTGNNRLIGAVIGVGGFLGFGEKEVAVEVARLEEATTLEAGRQLILNVRREDLERAPEFVTLAEQQRRREVEEARQMQEQQSQGEALTQ